MGGLKLVRLGSQNELFEIVAEWGAIRVGSTGEPSVRAATYTRDKYGGTMYYAETRNMRLAEDRLLKAAFESGGGRHNQHTLSNASEEPGYVYVIQGRRYQ